MLCPVTTEVDTLQLPMFLLLLSVSTRASVFKINHASSVVPATAFFHTSACWRLCATASFSCSCSHFIGSRRSHQIQSVKNVLTPQG